ncbi:hypothetical protein M9H77_21598 [Catharanthus roseus]|uniref:Uncharacterized protein n=1 Tax=Catharanthus roseus TaxID=4058 RepID=A0ACC0AN13_CATRO|nr:hypothetical protein M9H77_21598 [Catharanthus roseus]
MASLLEKNPDCAVRIEGRNTVEEVLHQCNQRGYRCYWRNCEENNILSDIVVVHSVSILIMRTWPLTHIDQNIVGKLTPKIGKERAELLINII